MAQTFRCRQSYTLHTHFASFCSLSSRTLFETISHYQTLRPLGVSPGPGGPEGRGSPQSRLRAGGDRVSPDTSPGLIWGVWFARRSPRSWSMGSTFACHYEVIPFMPHTDCGIKLLCAGVLVVRRNVPTDFNLMGLYYCSLDYYLEVRLAVRVCL